jgi:hypothetical protein
VPKDITAPRRGFSFKDFSLSKPNQPLPGDRLDMELDRLAVSFSNFEAFLRTSFEADGTLKGSTVEARNLKPGVLDPLTAQVDRAVQSALQIIDAREKSTQNLAIEARNATSEAKTAAQEAQQAGQEAKTLNQQSQAAAQAANQARARAEAALAPLSVTRADTLTAASSARIAEDMAYRWAEKTDGPVFVPNGGNPVDDGFFSAKYHAIRAGAASNLVGSQWQEVRDWHHEIETVFYPETKALHREFFSTYYGPFPTPPTEDPFGQPPTPGDLYFNTGINAMFVWNGSLQRWDTFDGGGTVSTFLDLTDTPNAYAGQAGSMVVVNPAADGLLFEVPFRQAQADARFLNLAGGTLTGFLLLHAAPTQPLHAATKGYADSLDAATRAAFAAADTQIRTDFASADTQIRTDFQAADAALQTQINTRLPLSGGTLTGALTLPGDPTQNLQAAPKQYVDTKVAALTGGQVIPSSATPIVLTGTSLNTLVITGTEAQIVTLPNAASAGLGRTFTITNLSTLVATVQANNGSAIGQPLEPGMTATYTCIQSSGGGAASWTQSFTGASARSGTGAVLHAANPVVSGALTLPGDPTQALHAAPKQYVDAKVAAIPAPVPFATEAEALAGTRTDRVMSPALVAARSGTETINTAGLSQVVFSFPEEVNKIAFTFGNVTFDTPDAGVLLSFLSAPNQQHSSLRQVLGAAYAAPVALTPTVGGGLAIDPSGITGGMLGTYFLERVPGSTVQWILTGWHRRGNSIIQHAGARLIVNETTMRQIRFVSSPGAFASNNIVSRWSI